MKPRRMTHEKHTDPRGWLVEVLRADETAEEMKHFFVSTSKPGIIRGNHSHARKTEWFCVVEGVGKLVLEHEETREREEVVLSGEKPETVEIPPGYVHAIQNIGDTEMILLVVVNEVFDSDDPDTDHKEVLC